MAQPTEDWSTGSIVGWTLVAVALPFLPLLLAGIEYLFFGTEKVEDLCRLLGIHDSLSHLYESLEGLFRTR